ncbi:hypothetical protein PUN28_011191 [Cardiocondyla obscurior]|uniref:Uncharacterized protein n=1 Tax=Cardiocondyla obscurior TaxID=286306 RepID=A0AAW2FL94_9HYME
MKHSGRTDIVEAEFRESKLRNFNEVRQEPPLFYEPPLFCEPPVFTFNMIQQHQRTMNHTPMSLKRNWKESATWGNTEDERG